MNAGLPGKVNGPMVGIVMKEMARRAMGAIAANRMDFIAKEKHSDHKAEDFVTTADNAAQRIYLKTLKEAFPTYGIIAEEDGLKVECTELGVDLYFTVDPLDGTKAFIRRQSHGVGTMISLVRDGEVIAACVGDVMTGEIYYYRPDSDKVHRFNWQDELGEVLVINHETPLADQYVLLGDDPRLYSAGVQWITMPRGQGGLFKNLEVMGGSIGIRMARLWKGEVGAVILKGGPSTPWDWCPIAGISKKLGFKMYECSSTSVPRWEWRSRDLSPIKETSTFENDLLIIHGSRLGELVAKI